MAKKSDFTFAAQMKKNGGYFHDITTNTLHITKDFERNANRIGTWQCAVMDSLMLNAATKPTVEVHTHKRAHRITYAMMEVFISKMPDAEANFVEYNRVILKSKVARNPYKEVLNWFEATFPYYGDLKAEKDGKLVWNALDEYRKALEEQAARTNNIVSLPQNAAEAHVDGIPA